MQEVLLSSNKLFVEISVTGRTDQVLSQDFGDMWESDEIE